MTKKNSLTLEDQADIQGILDTITTIPTIETTKGHIFSILEEGHPLNRMLRDEKTEKIIGFLVAEDQQDKEGNKIAYL